MQLVVQASSLPAARPLSSARPQSRAVTVTTSRHVSYNLSSVDLTADGTSPLISRRAALATATLVSLLSLRSPAWAEGELPQAYQDTARKLVKVLQESITKDLSGAEEREVRKAAEPAQELVKQVMTRWRGSEAVLQHESYRQLTSSIQELGAFYQASGSRTRMSEEVGNSILRRLAAAEESLPPGTEKKSLLPF